MSSLDAYKLPLLPAPQRVIDAVQGGVVEAAFPDLSSASQVLCGAQTCRDHVLRDGRGRVLVTCSTDLPGVTPAMIDWWFGWHLTQTQRYRLWHPVAHVSAVAKEDRSALRGDREKYVGNVSFVDEYIGRSLKKLAIEFVEPASMGFEMPDPGATAICARTSDRILGGQGGSLIHYVRPTAEGSQMRSGFWLGEIRHKVALIDGLMGPLLNTRAFRRVVVSDRFACDLLLHCGEEMNHLARFLPRLHGDLAGGR